MLAYKDEDGHWQEWHINETPPVIPGCVVTFQVDGDELNYLFACMKHVLYDKTTGGLRIRYSDKSIS